MKKSIVEGLSRAIQSWMDFQIVCNRDPLLSESYLAQPIGEFLSGRRSGDVDTEVNHPVLYRSGKGRPAQIDYVLKGRDKRNITTAIEAKWIPGSRKVDNQRILDDIMRLELLKQKNRLFLIAGRKNNYHKNFIQKKYKTKSNKGWLEFSKELLPHETGVKKTVDIRESNRGMKDFYKKYIDKYNLSGDKMPPGKFKTEKISDKKGEMSRVSIWEIKSTRGKRNPPCYEFYS